MSSVVTRFAPSPTGYLHIGGARTALFSWLYARHYGGKFILRIEDTDEVRSTEASVQAILDAMHWLDLDWDDGPYYQTRRLDTYREYLQRLLVRGEAYYCDCTPEELTQRREAAKAAGLKPKYDGRCRDRGLGPGPNRVVRFRCPDVGTTALSDLIKGPIFFENSELDDLVLQRSDGMPTYNFAVVIDDVTMGITHVIRGDDHVNNTPRQILLYQALGEPLPQFAHVPMILGQDRARMSKRHGATSVMAYKDMGYLPEALINYLVRLGWSHGDQEVFRREELIQYFTLNTVGKAPSVFNPEKLDWLNAHYIKERDPESLVPLLKPHLEARQYPGKPVDYLAKAVKTLQPRAHKLTEMADAMKFYMVDEVDIDPAAAKKFLAPENRPAIEKIMAALQSMETFDENGLEAVFGRVVEELGIKLGKIAQPVRVALTGATVSPGLFEIIDVLGKDTALRRLTRALQIMSS
jgi:glutamyl-tRNA synthetase